MIADKITEFKLKNQIRTVMRTLRNALFLLIFAQTLTSCMMFRHGDDQNYTLCKSLQGQIQFSGNTSYRPTAEDQDVDKQRLKETYDKLDCQRYQWFRF
jgi:hypothetical protein